ncbi:hypothetical protein CC1G_08551 [Coprinopsis cinerea okayama7|uniref:Uncharacterized protein n=1 Tax=Coprinopsis cinerea (strain Okayama-7 / 130 / ATCC MYA-4618 / FGSC 9003) TaxID=240176 RepID=A8ND82_COPC7|nr:hypothetical protein CC1G_08551 [Coprinopsis cinerea okayama7\|eukprot:XP_001832723.2 hypothetical protein CC1G_08551 [Coprinopsis cinerea okayama7\
MQFPEGTTPPEGCRIESLLQRTIPPAPEMTDDEAVGYGIDWRDVEYVPTRTSHNERQEAAGRTDDQLPYQYTVEPEEFSIVNVEPESCPYTPHQLQLLHQYIESNGPSGSTVGGYILLGYVCPRFKIAI